MYKKKCINSRSSPQSLSKSCFYNDRVSHLAVDKTLTDALFIIVLINAALKSQQVKNESAKCI